MITLVRVADYSNYKHETCCNGGDYGFSRYFHRINMDKWEIEYSTTADFGYCPCCGSFNEDNYDENGCYAFCHDEPTTITTSELIEIIKENKKLAKEYGEDSYFITYNTNSEYTDSENKLTEALVCKF